VRGQLEHFTLEALVDNLAIAADTPGVLEHRFHPIRRWRFDAAFPERMVAIEVDGGAFIGGRHTRGAGFKADCEKLNAAALHGWRIFRFLPEQVRNGEALKILSLALGVEGSDGKGCSIKKGVGNVERTGDN
jgi:very-short-patch-repair endonuclease